MPTLTPPRLPRQDYSRECVFFVTIRTRDRKRFFQHRALADDVFATLTHSATRKTIRVLAACLMPDHVHLLVRVTARPLDRWVASWKKFTTRLSRRHGVTGSLWDTSFHDRCSRRAWSLEPAVRYIAMNPVKARLVGEWTDYPYTLIAPTARTWLG